MRDNGELLYVCATKAEDLFKYVVERPGETIRLTNRSDRSEFLVVRVGDMKAAGYKVWKGPGVGVIDNNRAYREWIEEACRDAVLSGGVEWVSTSTGGISETFWPVPQGAVSGSGEPAARISRHTARRIGSALHGVHTPPPCRPRSPRSDRPFLLSRSGATRGS